jgi:fucose 4-O-acetylase-like acetyltransferase
MNKWLDKTFNVSILQEKRLSWIDYLRGIAIILVVYHHVRVGLGRANITVPTVLIEANMILYSFRMPLFFILSGIFISRSLIKKSVKQTIGIKFENLVYPYLIWTVLQITIQIIVSQFTNSQRSFIDYTYIFYHPRWLDQFWYLPALFNASMFYLFIRRFNLSPWIHILIALVLYYLSPFLLNISMLSDWMEFYIFFAIGNTITELFFRDNIQKFLANTFSLLLILPLFIVVQLYYLKHDIGEKALGIDSALYSLNNLTRILNQTQFLFIALIGCLTMFIVAFRLQSLNILKFLRIFGYHSLYIYVMHVIVIGFVRFAFTSLMDTPNPIVLLVAGIIFGVTLPIIFYNLLIKDGPFWFLFSFKRKKKPFINQTVQKINKEEMVTSQAS